MGCLYSKPPQVRAAERSSWIPADHPRTPACPHASLAPVLFQAPTRPLLANTLTTTVPPQHSLFFFQPNNAQPTPSAAVAPKSKKPLPGAKFVRNGSVLGRETDDINDHYTFHEVGGGTTHSQVFPHDYTREKKKVLPRRLPLPFYSRFLAFALILHFRSRTQHILCKVSPLLSLPPFSLRVLRSSIMDRSHHAPETRVS